MTAPCPPRLTCVPTPTHLDTATAAAAAAAAAAAGGSGRGSGGAAPRRASPASERDLCQPPLLGAPEESRLDPLRCGRTSDYGGWTGPVEEPSPARSHLTARRAAQERRVSGAWHDLAQTAQRAAPRRGARGSKPWQPVDAHAGGVAFSDSSQRAQRYRERQRASLAPSGRADRR